MFSYDFMTVSSSFIFPSSTFALIGRQTIQKTTPQSSSFRARGINVHGVWGRWYH
jgi:hypothetical protein